MKKDGRKFTRILTCSLFAIAITVSLVFLACAKPAGDSSQSPAVSADNSSALPVTPPSTPPSTPAATPPVATTPPPATSPQPPATPPPVYTPPPTANTVDPSVIITKQASQMLLTPEDMGQGWLKSTGSPPSKPQIYSASVVQYIQGGSFPPKVLNMAMVFRSIPAAQAVFESEKPANKTVSYLDIGNECFLDTSVPINKELVFRRNNVVEWVWLQNDKTGDPEHYARIVLQKVAP